MNADEVIVRPESNTYKQKRTTIPVQTSFSAGTVAYLNCVCPHNTIENGYQMAM